MNVCRQPLAGGELCALPADHGQPCSPATEGLAALREAARREAALVYRRTVPEVRCPCPDCTRARTGLPAYAAR